MWADWCRCVWCIPDASCRVAFRQLHQRISFRANVFGVIFQFACARKDATTLFIFQKRFSWRRRHAARGDAAHTNKAYSKNMLFRFFNINYGQTSRWNVALVFPENLWFSLQQVSRATKQTQRWIAANDIPLAGHWISSMATISINQWSFPVLWGDGITPQLNWREYR